MTSAGMGKVVLGLVLSLIACTPSRAVVSVATPSLVPTTAPDITPSALWDSLIDPANIIVDPPGITGSYIRDLVYVQFVDGATQAERQAAIDAVRGTVVGGIAIGNPEHLYAVRIPYSLAPGDSISGPMFRAVSTLTADPNVAVASLAGMYQWSLLGGQRKHVRGEVHPPTDSSLAP